MRRVMQLGAVAVIAAGAIGGLAAVGSAHSDQGGSDPGKSPIKHVLLISVDGMHQSDLNWYIAQNPGSELAKLASEGAEFTNNHTSVPSDSDPGGTALMTGGDPRATGAPPGSRSWPRRPGSAPRRRHASSTRSNGAGSCDAPGRGRIGARWRSASPAAARSSCAPNETGSGGGRARSTPRSRRPSRSSRRICCCAWPR